jgi:GNAT superfamily N-acetyltransferase
MLEDASIIMGSAITVRTATAADSFAIAETHVASWRATYPGIVPQAYIDSLKVEEFAPRWHERLANPSDQHILVAEQGGAVCGFASGGPGRGQIEGHPGELYAIYLSPAAEGRGIGSRLFWGIARALAWSGRNGMYAWALQQNPACRFYERIGGVLLREATIEIGGAMLVEVAYGWLDLKARLA